MRKYKVTVRYMDLKGWHDWFAIEIYAENNNVACDAVHSMINTSATESFSITAEEIIP